MNEHALELLHVALWLLGVVGAAMVGIGVWGTQKMVELIRDQHESLETLKDLYHAVEVRLRAVEVRCEVVSNSSQYHRRSTDLQPGSD